MGRIERITKPAYIPATETRVGGFSEDILRRTLEAMESSGAAPAFIHFVGRVAASENPTSTLMEDRLNGISAFGVAGSGLIKAIVLFEGRGMNTRLRDAYSAVRIRRWAADDSLWLPEPWNEELGSTLDQIRNSTLRNRARGQSQFVPVRKGSILAEDEENGEITWRIFDDHSPLTVEEILLIEGLTDEDTDFIAEHS